MMKKSKTDMLDLLEKKMTPSSKVGFNKTIFLKSIRNTKETKAEIESLVELKKQNQLLISSIKDLSDRLVSCRLIEEKLENINTYFQKTSTKAGLFRDIPDKEMSFNMQSRLQKFLKAKIVDNNPGIKYADITAEKPSDSAIKSQFDKLLSLENKSEKLNVELMKNTFETVNAELDALDKPLNKILKSELESIFDKVWEAHKDIIVKSFAEQFLYWKNQSICLDYILEASAEDLSSMIGVYYKRSSVNRLWQMKRSFPKIF